MDKIKFKEIIEKLELQINKWIDLYEIDTILLKNGIGIYPDWKHLRFLLTENEIFIQHGNSTPYGAKLSNRVQVSYDRINFNFDPNSVIFPSKYYGEFRYPKVGDIMRLTDGVKVYSEASILKVDTGFNALAITLLTPLRGPEANLSFYDPTMYDKDLCMHSNPEEGVYMRFKPNENGKFHKQFGIYQGIIKIKDIDGITLNVNSKYNNKKYKIE